MSKFESGTLPYTIIGSLLIAVFLLAIRIYAMQGVQKRRQRENRQETERLKSMVAAYRALAGSFTPATKENSNYSVIEEALAEIVLFGSLTQVELAVDCIRKLKVDDPVDYQPLIHALRVDLRRQLGLEPIPASIILPPAGPGRTQLSGKGNGNEGGGGLLGGMFGGGGGGGGDGAFAGGAMVGAGGVGAGLMTSEHSTNEH